MLQINSEFLGDGCASPESKTPHSLSYAASLEAAKEGACGIFQGPRHIDLTGDPPDKECTMRAAQTLG